MIMLFLNILYISLNVVYREGHNFPPEIGLINVGGYNEQAYIWAILKKPVMNLSASITPIAVFAVPFADKKILFTKCIPTA